LALTSSSAAVPRGADQSAQPRLTAQNIFQVLNFAEGNKRLCVQVVGTLLTRSSEAAS